MSAAFSEVEHAVLDWVQENDVFSLGLQLMSHAANETFDESMLLVYSQHTHVCLYAKMPLLLGHI